MKPVLAPYQAGDLETAENAFSASLAEVTSRR